MITYGQGECYLHMIKGKQVVLRAVREDDMPALIGFLNDTSLRGPYLPKTLLSPAMIQKEFRETGNLGSDRGQLLVTDHDDGIIGSIRYFTMGYLDGFELSYFLYDTAGRRRGVMTEALGLAVDYLFDSYKINRLQVATVPANEPAIRLAKRCGFKLEGTMRGAFFMHGRSEDLVLYSLLRSDLRR